MSQHTFSMSPQDVPKIKSEHRHIYTSIPAAGTEKIFKRLSKVESRSMHGQLPIVWDRAEDFSVFDIAE